MFASIDFPNVHFEFFIYNLPITDFLAIQIKIDSDISYFFF